MSKIGTLHTHFYLDGLFIVTYHSDKRIGLKSIDTGTMRYIDHRLFLSQYKALSTGISNTWAHTCYIISIHILHSQYCNFSIHPPDLSPHTHVALSAWHIMGIYDALAACYISNKVAVSRTWDLPCPYGRWKICTNEKNPLRGKTLHNYERSKRTENDRKKLYITMGLTIYFT